METPYQSVLATLSLDADFTLLFTRTGSRQEPIRVARTPVRHLLGARHWVVKLMWDAETMTVQVHDQDSPSEESVKDEPLPS